MILADPEVIKEYRETYGLYAAKDLATKDALLHNLVVAKKEKNFDLLCEIVETMICSKYRG